MEWLPHTIDAFSKLTWQGGLSICVFTLVLGSVFLLWRHLGQMIVLFTEYVRLQASANETQKSSHAELKVQTTALADISRKVTVNNEMTEKLLVKLGGDNEPICKATT